MSLSQGLHQKMLQKLSPQQIQLMKLFQVPTVLLEQRIKEEMEENPALELLDDEPNLEPTNSELETEKEQQEENEEPEIADEYENIDISDYVTDGDDDVADYKLRDENYPEESNSEIPIKSDESFYQLLKAQLGMLSLAEHEQTIAEHIIGSIDEDGYLRRDSASIVDDLAFRQNLLATEKEVENVVQQIQQFDPSGICARNLQECLLIQLKRQEENQDVSSAIKILETFFEEFTKKHYEKIQKGLSLTDEELKEAINHVLKLNPKPGGQASTENATQHYIVPDYYIENSGGKLLLTLNSKNAPELRVSDEYREMMRDYEKGAKNDKKQKEAVLFIKQKLDSAKWFIDAIKQRQHTLLNTMNAILEHQQAFFASGDETKLKPMILKDIAEVTGLDISTISRVANSKFVQTEYGTYRIKYFFSESLATESGEEVSTREVKKILTDLIDSENKNRPLSDEELTSTLVEKGYNIARRTVAKYREQLNIPVARLRKVL